MKHFNLKIIGLVCLVVMGSILFYSTSTQARVVRSNVQRSLTDRLLYGDYPSTLEERIEIWKSVDENEKFSVSPDVYEYLRTVMHRTDSQVDNQEYGVLLFGCNGHIYTAIDIPTINVDTHIEIDAAKYFRIIQEQYDTGKEIIAIFHTHPSLSVDPSSPDHQTMRAHTLLLNERYGAELFFIIGGVIDGKEEIGVYKIDCMMEEEEFNNIYYIISVYDNFPYRGIYAITLGLMEIIPMAVVDNDTITNVIIRGYFDSDRRAAALEQAKLLKWMIEEVEMPGYRFENVKFEVNLTRIQSEEFLYLSNGVGRFYIPSGMPDLMEFIGSSIVISGKVVELPRKHGEHMYLHLEISDFEVIL